jgi:hypothetical protein
VTSEGFDVFVSAAYSVRTFVSVEQMATTAPSSDLPEPSTMVVPVESVVIGRQVPLPAASGEEAPLVVPRAVVPQGTMESDHDGGAIPLAPSVSGSSSSRKRRNEEKTGKKTSEKKARKKEEEKAKKKTQKARHETLKHAARRAVRNASRHFADVLGAGGGSFALAKHSK